MKLVLGLVACCILMSESTSGQTSRAPNRWQMERDGSIVWNIKSRLPHEDHIEMSGQQVSAIIRYGVHADSTFHIERTIVWPMLRTIPNNTHASLTRSFDWNILHDINVNGRPMASGKVHRIVLNGMMTVVSRVEPGLEISGTFFPSAINPSFLEQYQLKNNSGKMLFVEVPVYKNTYHTEASQGVYGSYQVMAQSLGGDVYQLEPGDSISFGAVFQACQEDKPVAATDISEEAKHRQALVRKWWENLVVETPDELLNRAFNFAKIRASESIYKTKGGLMHSPGGGAYYAAIWANDEAEYVGPFFPFLGYSTGNEASLNAYLHFARYMNPEYTPIPSSIIAEGTDIWNGAGDRGDAAMIAYGAARFALEMGDPKKAEQLWPLIVWCLEYNRRNVNKNGVVTSDSDELEGRFPAGDANLSTASLYYDALLSASYLGRSLGKSSGQLSGYRKQAVRMKKAIEDFFGHKVDGFKTYRYYEGNDVLRSWICIPLTVGIYERKEGTVEALFSPLLWTNDGLATQAGDQTFWDRSTLYALRGVFAAGETEKALTYLQYYSNRRLLGEHVPYPVEAYPEGNQRHLSAESGLYCRIFTEGIFGIRPTGLHSFQLTPHLPEAWDHMALRNIHAFDRNFDLEIRREQGKLQVTVTSAGKITHQKTLPVGDTVTIDL